MAADPFVDEDSRVLTPEAFDFILNNELKRAIRSQNYLTLLRIEATESSPEADGPIRVAQELAQRRQLGIARNRPDFARRSRSTVRSAAGCRSAAFDGRPAAFSRSVRTLRVHVSGLNCGRSGLLSDRRG
jgi:hypothetical protein